LGLTVKADLMLLSARPMLLGPAVQSDPTTFVDYIQNKQCPLGLVGQPDPMLLDLSLSLVVKPNSMLLDLAG
jgi:hypothetical protein